MNSGLRENSRCALSAMRNAIALRSFLAEEQHVLMPQLKCREVLLIHLDGVSVENHGSTRADDLDVPTRGRSLASRVEDFQELRGVGRRHGCFV